jgi:hypothetical protein
MPGSSTAAGIARSDRRLPRCDGREIRVADGMEAAEIAISCALPSRYETGGRTFSLDALRQ